jgi:hypothetical protein
MQITLFKPQVNESTHSSVAASSSFRQGVPSFHEFEVSLSYSKEFGGRSSPEPAEQAAPSCIYALKFVVILNFHLQLDPSNLFPCSFYTNLFTEIDFRPAPSPMWPCPPHTPNLVATETCRVQIMKHTRLRPLGIQPIVVFKYCKEARGIFIRNWSYWTLRALRHNSLWHYRQFTLCSSL